MTLLTESAQANPATSTPQVFLMIAEPWLEGLYRKRLQNNKYCAVWYETGTNYEAALTHFAYDIIVFDFALFPADPIHTLRQLKKCSPDSEIIIISPSEDVRLAIAAFQNGITDYFLKPVEPEQLAWAVEKILRRKEFTSSNASLAHDLHVFRTAHNIGMSENDYKMRELVARNLIKMLRAKGAMWIWSHVPELVSAPENRTEYFGTTDVLAEKALKLFKLKHPGVIEKSFENELTSHPDEWFRGRSVWIPLRTAWMGGIFLFGTPTQPNSEAAARMEFLIRNLEVSLENWKRYIDTKQLTYVDDCTGLFNSRYLDVALTGAIAEANSNNMGFAVLFIDVDHFKKVNDSHGHLVGSSLLIKLAQSLKNLTRKADQIFRYGGDEFIVVLNGVTPEISMAVAERIRRQIEKQHYKIHGVDVQVTVSIGVSRFPEHTKDKKQIIELADKAMYSGKRRGRNAVFQADY